jgi:hypothetical protein
MAVHAKLKITPSRNKMNVGEQQSVEIFAHDCDGEDHPLKNRKIKLKSDNGTFSPAEVTTGADGKVKATFTAQKKGLADLEAIYYPYTTVTHHQSGAHDNAHVQIGDPPSGVWQVDIEVTDNDFDDTVSSKTAGDEHHAKNDHQSIKRAAHVTLWVRQSTDDTGNPHGSEVIAASGSGIFNFSSTFYHLDTSPGCTQRVNGVHNAEGRFTRDETVFAFDIYPDHANVNGTIRLNGSGADDTWHFESCADPPNVHQHGDENDVGYPVEFGYGSDQLDAPQTAQTRSSKVFKFDLNKHETETNAETGNTTTRDRTGTITLRPLTVSQTPANIRRH